MIRIFENHRIRKVKELDGMWDFKKENSDKQYKLPVPGCWEQHPEMLTYQGKGEFKKAVYVEKSDLMLYVSHIACHQPSGVAGYQEVTFQHFITQS